MKADGFVMVMHSEYCRLLRAEAERDILRNAVAEDVPKETVLKVLGVGNSELDAYRATGLTPEQMVEIDKLYAEKCKELAAKAFENQELKRQLAEARGK